eukprot:TRINITY_DN26716_c0_g2_i2.p1 TRINITY_DN26716_c0_g2~~TRINITY_DN26716_c0_g2_i2.p1  ORF type:complete len:702 (+),score=90.69 TRINITY_DN26716_c0_g2_i2:123-2228(+)
MAAQRRASWLLLSFLPNQLLVLAPLTFPLAVSPSSAEAVSRAPWEAKLERGKFKGFPSYQEANALLEEWLGSHPGLLRKERIGESFEKRPIFAYVLTNKADGASSGVAMKRPQVLLTALMHSREPAGLTVVLYFVGHLLDLYARNDAQALYALRDREIWIIPFVNPDGYVANERSSRPVIRKNQRPTCKNKLKSGVDINRNFPTAWRKGAFPPCDEEYGGTEPFSEPETRAIRDVVNQHDFRAAVNFHSFGSMLTHPFNWAPTAREAALPVADDNTIYREIQKAFGFTRFGPAIKTVGYTAIGESDDWLYSAKGIISMSPEVGPESGDFFPPVRLVSGIDSRNFKRAMYIVIKAGMELAASCQHVAPGSTHFSVADPHGALALRLRNSGLSATSGAQLGVAILLKASAAPGVSIEVSSGAGVRMRQESKGDDAIVAFQAPALARRSRTDFVLRVANAQASAFVGRHIHVCVHESGVASSVCHCFKSLVVSASKTRGSTTANLEHAELVVGKENAATAQDGSGLCMQAITASGESWSGDADTSKATVPLPASAAVIPVNTASPSAALPGFSVPAAAPAAPQSLPPVENSRSAPEVQIPVPAVDAQTARPTSPEQRPTQTNEAQVAVPATSVPSQDVFAAVPHSAVIGLIVVITLPLPFVVWCSLTKLLCRRREAQKATRVREDEEMPRDASVLGAQNPAPLE